MNGTFLGLVDLDAGDLQFCKASESVLDAAFVFGTTYERKASLPAFHFRRQYSAYLVSTFCSFLIVAVHHICEGSVGRR